MQKDQQFLDEAFEEICRELVQTFLAKHRDYGKGNILDIEELGIAFRVSEKISRIKNLLSKPGEPQNESIDDSWTDIAVYAVIARLFRQGKFQALEVNPEKNI
jgi:hypothetical protein